MGLIRTEASSRLIPSCCLIGRSRACQFRVNTPETSNEHALLRWLGNSWELQDLYSRNGTWVDGRRLSGRRVSLAAGAKLRFGSQEEVILVDAGPPEPHAVGLDPPHTTVEAQAGSLALPDLPESRVMVRRRDERWWLERADEVKPVDEGAVVATNAGLWLLHLPESIPATRDAEGVPPTLAALTLRFIVHKDGGIVEFTASRGDRRLDLKTRAHHAPLLALARARLAESERSSEEQGWVEQDEIVRQLGCDASRFHVDIHRIRRQFIAAGVVDAANVVERCQGSRKLRLGVSAVEIITLP